MSPNSPSSILIIGGGFCGVMTMVNLLKKAKSPIEITLFNASYPEGRGIAYSTYSDQHVLNVQTRNMSAFVDDPDHFLNWVKETASTNTSAEELPGTYLPRNLYGKYIDHIYQNALKSKPEHVSLRIINEEVIDLDEKENRVEVITSAGNKFSGDKALLATGNHLPGNPPIENKDFFKSRRYFANPWHAASVSNTEGNSPILIIGTGLTMVDVVLGLRENNFSGKIIALSPKGFSILAHKKHHQQRYILDELSPPYTLTSLYKLFYKHVRNAHRRGESGETVVDAVRSKTQEIWQQLSLEDKKSFMSHVRHLWGVARHRLPGDIHAFIQSLIKDEKLEVLAGRIQNIVENDGEVHVTVKPKSGNDVKELRVSRVINCTGPQTDITRFNSPLYQSALKKNIVSPDEMRLGIHASPEGAIHSGKSSLNGKIFTIGTLLKGQLWESTAVPELRVQADRMAEMLLQ